jgi:ParB family chromosome partitioning protein
MSEINYINISKIDPPENDGRLEIDVEFDQELASSIKEMGVLEPLIVRKNNKRIEIIAGSSRFRASKIAGLDSVPCIIVKSDDSFAEKIKLHENLKRRDLSHVDQGMIFARLRTEFKLTENEISNLVGKSIPYISQHISLITSSEELIASVQNYSISFSVARELMQVKNKDDQNHLLNFAIKGGASVSTVKEWVSTAIFERKHSTYDKPLNISENNYASKTIPTFTCQACEHSHVIKEMIIKRLCPECDFLIFDEIRKQKELIASTIANGSPETAHK